MIVDDIALTMQPRIGPATAAHLVRCFGSAEKVFAATPEQLIGEAQLHEGIARETGKKQYHKQAEKELRYCEKNGITPICATSQAYPQLLKECNDYPHVIYCKGNADALAGRMLSVVGTRRMTRYGQKMCEEIVAGLARMFPDLVVVSGLAFGVDAAAHRAAIASGIPTIGVLANPLPGIYPSQHEQLAEQMVRCGGALMSEYHSQTKRKGVTFVPRNRIIAGMSMGTLVVESPIKSGSRITASMADGYDRCVMAVPGRVGDVMSEGCNFLIKAQKARMVCSAEDVAREMMWDIPEMEPQSVDLSGLGREAAALYESLPAEGAVGVDELAGMTGLSLPVLAALMLELEFDGLVKSLPGKMYEKL